MRILLVSNLYPPYVEGGAEILAHDVAMELKNLGHEVLTLTSSFGLAKARRDEDEGVWRTLRIFPVAHFDGRLSAVRQLNQLYNFYRRYHCAANARELRRVIKEMKPDVVYIWEVTGVGVTSLMKALARVDLPMVFHLGSYWLLFASRPETEQSRIKASGLKRRLIGSFPVPAHASMIAVSETVKQKHVEGGFDGARIEVIYNGIDATFLNRPVAEREESEGERPFSLLYAGRLRVEKGIAVIFKALALLAKERGAAKSGKLPFHLHIFGSGDKVYVDELQTLLIEHQLSEAVTFHGKVAQDELIGWYDRADAMLVPSLWQEPFGLVLAEGMARKLPVIASNLGGPAEILTNEVNGLLVTPGDEQELSMSIGRLMDDRQLRERLGGAARRTVEERFTIESDARHVEEHLRRAVQEWKKG